MSFPSGHTPRASDGAEGLLEQIATSLHFANINGDSVEVILARIAAAAQNAGSVATTPSGAAGGDLSGTYPNPTVAKVNGAVLSAMSSGEATAGTAITPRTIAPNVLAAAIAALGGNSSVTIGDWPGENTGRTTIGSNNITLHQDEGGNAYSIVISGHSITIASDIDSMTLEPTLCTGAGWSINGTNGTITANHLSTGDLTSSGDLEVTDNTKGIILKSPDDTRYRITVENDGTLTTTAL